MTLITNYQSLLAPANFDVIPIVDVSDTAQSSAGTTKKITFQALTASLGGGGGGGGSSAVDWINVTQAPYSAVGNGSTDCTTAIQDAITVASGNGGVVYFPAGVYNISSALTLPSAVTLLGDAAGYQYEGGAPLRAVSVIKQTSTTANGIVTATPCTGMISIRDLVIQGPGSGSGTGFYLQETGGNENVNLFAERVLISSFGGYGWHLVAMNFSSLRDCYAAGNGASGFYGGGATNVWSNCYAVSNSGDGFTFTTGSGDLQGLYTELNSGNGLNISGMTSATFSGCTTENDALAGTVVSASFNISFIGHYASYNNSYGLQISGNVYGCSVIEFYETSGTGAIHGLYAESGSSTFLVHILTQTESSYPSSYCTQILQEGVSTYSLALNTALTLANGGTGGTTAATAIASLVASGIPEVTFTGAYSPAVSNLTFSTTVAVNAALGNDFRLSLTASTATMGNPTNAVNGQEIKFQITQGAGGSFTLAWGSAYDFGTAGAPTLSTAAGKIDIVKFAYNSTKGAWLCTGASLGF